MRAGVLPALICLSLVITGCLSSSPPPHPLAAEDGMATASDSLTASAYEKRFIEMHGRLLAKIGGSKGNDPDIIEAGTIVEIAEEFYLQGDTLLAIRLLTEAETLLRQIP